MAAIINLRSTFCTLFNIYNEHLTKDVGLIPYAMHKFGGYDSFIATYINGDYSNLKYTPGLRIEEIPQGPGSFHRNALYWLRKNAKRIDVLNMYHTHKKTMYLALAYKFFNPAGKVYVKLDGWPLEYINKLLGWPVRLTRNPLKKLRNNLIYRILFRACSLVSTEFEECAEVLSHDFGRKFACVPNPINVNEVKEYRPFSERSNTILTVGRLGTEQKATEILLEAFAKISGQIPGWKLKLVGAVTEQDIEEFFRGAHPGLMDRVILTGPISDREQITEIYRDAKIFAFPTRYESFGIALTEAMMHGEFAVLSRIPSNEYLTNNYRFASSSAVDDVDGMAANLLYACTHENEIERLAIEGREETLKRCDMKRIAGIISDGLK